MYEILRRKENYINQWLVERELHILQFLMPVTSAFQPPPLVFLYLLEKAAFPFLSIPGISLKFVIGIR